MENKILIENLKIKYSSCFEEGIYAAKRVLRGYPNNKILIAGELFGFMFIVGKKELNIDNLLFEEYNKFDLINKWILQKLENLCELGCNRKILTSVYLNFWIRSEGRIYIENLNETNNIDSADWVRNLTGFSRPYYILCLSVINVNNLEYVISITETRMVKFINDINDLVSMEKDKRCNVLNTLKLVDIQNSSKSRILSNISELFGILDKLEFNTIYKINVFMIDYINGHLECKRYIDMTLLTREYCKSLILLINNYIKYNKLKN